MAKKAVKKKKGWQGPGPGRRRLESLHVMMTFPKSVREELDAWKAEQPDPDMTYPEAIRRLIRPTLERWKKSRAK